MSSVGSELLNEIERVSAKRERWKSYMADMGPAGVGMGLSIALMTKEINEAKAAIRDDDAVRSILALKALQGYDEAD